MTRALYSVLLVVLLAFTAVFAITRYSDAQETTTCPAGTVLSADGTACLSEAVNDNVVTTTSCTVGVLSADGTQCIVPRADAVPVPATTAIEAPIPTFTG